MSESDQLHDYDELLERMKALAIEWHEEGPVGTYGRYERERDLMQIGRWQPGSNLVRCPQCNNNWRLRDTPCSRCHGVGTVMCTKVEVRDGLI